MKGCMKYRSSPAKKNPRIRNIPEPMGSTAQAARRSSEPWQSCAVAQGRDEESKASGIELKIEVCVLVMRV